MMLDGIAIGGPRAGVKISAGASWDGRIAMPRPEGNTSNVKRFHPGKYEWSVKLNTWEWKPIPERKVAPAARAYWFNT